VSQVGVIFGGPSPEHDVSVLTGLQAARELAGSLGHTVRALYWSKSGEWFEVDPGLEARDFLDAVPSHSIPLRLVLGTDGRGFYPASRRLRRATPLSLDAVVVCCHGGPGEDGTLQASLDLVGMAYTGPSLAGAGLGMDKLAFHGVMTAAGLPTLPRVLLEEHTKEVGFSGPFIVKPRFGGSSIGIQVVEDLDTARIVRRSNVHLGAGAVVEPYRGDLFDLQIAVRNWPSLELSAIERPLRTARAGGAAEPEFLGYADKYVGGEGMASAPRELPARISSSLERSIRTLAEEVARLVGVRGIARIDFLSDGEDLLVNEINTIPGSLARYLWIDPPRSFATLLADLLEEARQSPTHRYDAAGADGSVLRGASSIAAKLA